jgi:hypothetical protein
MSAFQPDVVHVCTCACNIRSTVHVNCDCERVSHNIRDIEVRVAEELRDASQSSKNGRPLFKSRERF